MAFDSELIKQLVETFKVELEEKLQVITDGLLELEKNKDCARKEVVVAEIFRAGHNIKGTARGIGINDVAAIAHRIESRFEVIQKSTIEISSSFINLCFEAIDKMRIAMQSFCTSQPLPFDIDDLLKRLETDESAVALQIDTAETAVSRSSIEVKKKSSPEKSTKDEASEHKSIRVSLDSLDRLSALIEEMQVNKIAIDEHFHEISKLSDKSKQFIYIWKKWGSFLKTTALGKNEEAFNKFYLANSDYVSDIFNLITKLHKNIRSKVDDLDLLSNALQYEVRTLRLIPAATLLRTLPRQVRDLAFEVNKKIDLTIHGDDVKMDKMVLEGLHDPLVHLLRNAVDHGIEDTSVRKEKGKSEIGHISISVSDEGGKIFIKIQDDGGGININNIAKAAITKNIMTQTDRENMSNNEVLNLIFLPGFSTKETVTSLSGRGVGLDVVKANIDDLKGQVQVSTEAGFGTTFYLQVPLTLASERGLMVRCADQMFVIPTSNVEQVLALNKENILDIEGGQAFTINNHFIYLRSLGDILNIVNDAAALTPKRFPTVVLKRSGFLVALVVDEIIGEREIIVKPLQAPLSDISCIAGGTLSGSGQVILVLDPGNLIDLALHVTTFKKVFTQLEYEIKEERPHILVVDDSITTRTLEKSILESKNYLVTVAVDGKEAWELLQKQPFSLLITDVSMPNMDGFTLTELVKKCDKLKNLPVVIVTSLDSDAEKKRGLDAGADKYVVKSEFESGKLLEVVVQLL
jgi:two-component system chemotaxis sensor kinase CheA